MRVTVREPEVLGAIPPDKVALYLAAHDWALVEERLGSFSIWEHREHKRRVLLPVSQEFGDYPLRIVEILEATQAVEGRSQLEILSDLTSLYCDVVRLRHLSGNVGDASIPLEAGIELVANAKDLLVSAAHAAIKPQPYYAYRMERASEYLKRVRLGQTEYGSFVVTLISPIFSSVPLPGRPAAEPFERAVTRTLLQAVAAAVLAAEEAERKSDISPFSELVHLGVSANLCEALVDLHRETGAVELGISISWAPGRDLVTPAIPQRVRIPQKLVPVLEEASRVFRDTGTEPSTRLTGAVIDLHSEWRLHEESPQGAGLITIAGPVEGRVRKVRVTLPMPDYLKAVDAHRQGHIVSVVGRIQREGNYFTLAEPQGFQVEPE